MTKTTNTDNEDTLFARRDGVRPWNDDRLQEKKFSTTVRFAPFYASIICRTKN